MTRHYLLRAYTTSEGQSWCSLCDKQLHHVARRSPIFHYQLVAGSDGIPQRMHVRCAEIAIDKHGMKQVKQS